MIGRFLKKDVLSTHNHHRLNKLESSLKNSFFNIKKDVFKITTSIVHHENNVATHNSHLNSLKERLDKMESLLFEVQKSLAQGSQISKNYTPKGETKSQIGEKQEIHLPGASSVLDQLTPVQQNILFRLGTLHVESNTSWVLVKSLIEDLYPDKEYHAVRSMVSEYLDILVGYGLIKKIRKGKSLYSRLTERGIAMFDKAKQKKLLEIVK